MNYRQYFLRIGRICLLMVLVVVIFFVMGETIDDGTFLPFYPTPVESLVEPITQNTTAHLAEQKMPRQPDENWMALYHTLRIVETVAPDVAQWVSDLHNRGQLVFDFDIAVDHPVYATTYAFQSTATGHLLLSSHYWTLTDIEKAGVLVHEYRHSRQNFFKVMAGRAIQIASITGLLNPDESRLEDEAYLYQYEFYTAIGYNAPSLETWLQHRKILLNSPDPS